MLAADARISFTDLGRATGLSTSAVTARVRRLSSRGLIRGFTAQLDHEQLGFPLVALISLRPIDPSEPDDVPERLREITEIESCYSVAGEAAYVLIARTPSPAALEDLLAVIRAKANVSTTTTVVLSTPFEHRPVVQPSA